MSLKKTIRLYAAISLTAFLLLAALLLWGSGAPEIIFLAAILFLLNGMCWVGCMAKIENLTNNLGSSPPSTSQ